MEESIPEDYVDGYLPILDNKMRLERVDGITRIRHLFYRKPMASKEVTWARSALTTRSKRDILIQDLVRRLRNCDSAVSEKEKEEIISEYSYSMKIGGHTESFRHLVCLRAMRSHLNAVQMEKKGRTRMYRSRKEVEERWEAVGGRPRKADWFHRGGVTGILTVLRRVPEPTDQFLRVKERPDHP